MQLAAHRDRRQGLTAHIHQTGADELQLVILAEDEREGLDSCPGQIHSWGRRADLSRVVTSNLAVPLPSGFT